VIGDRFSDAAPHNSTLIHELTECETRLVIADAAYRSPEREQRLERCGICYAIAFKRRRGQKNPLAALKRLYRVIASVRLRVQFVFA
jgi:IS5 family transposase